MTRWWKSGWGIQSARINALSLRERVFLFLSVIACCMVFADVVWLSPAQLAHRQLTQRFDKQSSELQRARESLSALAKPVDTTTAVHDEIAAVKIRLDTVNQRIKDVMPAATQATPLAQALVHLLRRHEGLTLVRTSVVAPAAAAPTVAAVPVATVPVATVPLGLTRQGVELSVSGSYSELTRYVQTLEMALPHVRWGVMKVKSEKLPPELTLQLFLIGVQP